MEAGGQQETSNSEVIPGDNCELSFNELSDVQCEKQSSDPLNANECCKIQHLRNCDCGSDAPILPSGNETTAAASEEVSFSHVSDSQEDAAQNDCDKDHVGPLYQLEGLAQLITGAWQEFQSTDECCTKGCKWSPDGTCILSNSEDKVLRIFDLPPQLHCQETWALGRTLPELRPALRIREGGRIYDFCWYPFMSSWNPLSCCLVASSQFSPVHLWDAYSGQLRATYRSYNSMDEIEHAFSVAFSLSGEKLYCGFKKRISVFATAQPGSKCDNRTLKGLGRPVGIISCICVNPADDKMYAFSSYSRTIGVCSEPGGEVVCLLCNTGGGLTHLSFSPDGQRLYAGARNDRQLFCWDMRMLGRVLFTVERPRTTNQRIYFDLTPDGRYLISGATDGRVLMWDTLKAAVVETAEVAEAPTLPIHSSFPAHGDCVNGVSLHRQYPVLATCSGQRHPQGPFCLSEDEGPPLSKDDSLKLWWLGNSTVQ